MTRDLGFNISNSRANAASDCALAASLGATGVRVSQEEGWGSPADLLGPYRKACDDHGLWLMQCCQPIGHVQPRTQKRLDEYGAFTAESSTIADYTSADNEWNGYGSNETPDPVACAQTMLACLGWRDSHAPGRMLMTGSICPASGPLGARYVEPLLFVTTMFDAEPSILDARHLLHDWHGYCDSRYPATTRATWNTADRTGALQAQLKKRHHGREKVSWSEFGSATGPPGWVQRVDEPTQALRFDQYIEEMVALEGRGVRFGPSAWYQLRDRKPQSSTDWPACCGMVRLDGSLKPVAARFTAAVKGA